MARALIAGCGDVGCGLAELLSADGHEVWGLKRQPRALPEGVRPLAADLTDPATLQSLPPDLDWIVYTAAAGGFNDQAYTAAYVQGPGHLLRALQQAGQSPRRVLFTSSTGVYAQKAGEWVDEESPAEPDEFSGRRVREGEQVFLGGPFPAVVLRLGGIYGPGRTWLIDRVRGGEARLPAGPPLYTNRIHRDDAARALHHLLGLGQPAPLYLGVDHEPAAEAEVLQWLAQRLGVSLSPGAEPPPPGLRPRSNKRCRNARLLSSGFTFRYPTFREGYAALAGSP